MVSNKVNWHSNRLSLNFCSMNNLINARVIITCLLYAVIKIFPQTIQKSQFSFSQIFSAINPKNNHPIQSFPHPKPPSHLATT